MGPNAPSRLLPQMSLCPCLCPSDSHCWHDCLASTNDNHDFHGQATKTGDGPCTLVSWVGGGVQTHWNFSAKARKSKPKTPPEHHFCPFLSHFFKKNSARPSLFVWPGCPFSPFCCPAGKQVAGWLDIVGQPSGVRQP